MTATLTPPAAPGTLLAVPAPMLLETSERDPAVRRSAGRACRAAGEGERVIHAQEVAAAFDRLPIEVRPQSRR